MTFVRRRGRPLGAKAFAIVELVRQQPFTVRGMAHELRLSYADAAVTVARLAQAGHVRYGDIQRNTGGRPARLIEPSTAPVRAEPAPAFVALDAFFRNK